MTKTLISNDYDPTAQKVGEAGYPSVKSMNAEVTLLHVMSDPIYSSVENAPITRMSDSLGVNPLVSDADDRLKEVSQHFLVTIKHHPGENTIETRLEERDFRYNTDES